VMGIAEGMPALIAFISGPVVMPQHPDELREQAEGVQRFGTAFRVGEVSGQRRRAEHVQPVQCTIHTQAGFVGMGDQGRDA